MSTMDAFSAHGATARAAREARQQKLDDARATLDDFVDEFNDKVKDAFLGVFTIDEVAEMFAQACKDETDPNVLAASVVGMVKFLRLLFPKADEATATARANEAIKKVNS